jgi:hypothetical protein
VSALFGSFDKAAVREELRIAGEEGDFHGRGFFADLRAEMRKDRPG